VLARAWLEESSGLKVGDFHLAYSPERIMTGYSISRLREFPKVIGGVDNDSGFVAYGVYKKFISNLSMVSTAKTAELIKVMEGCYRDVNIALANELFKIAEEIGSSSTRRGPTPTTNSVISTTNSVILFCPP